MERPGARGGGAALILGLETSCDETAGALVTVDGELRSAVTASQAHLHARFGGVVPEVASRRHLELVLPVIRETLAGLLDDFAALRRDNLRELTALRVTDADLDRRGRHPELGVVTLRQLLATWVAHDLDHIVQISRVLARQYSGEVGPWTAYLRIISGQQG